MNIIEVLQQQRDGKAVREYQRLMQDLVRECRETGTSGKLTIVLTVQPKTDGSVVLTDEPKVTPPKRQRGTTSFYDDEEGALLREDPKQPELPSIAKAAANDR